MSCKFNWYDLPQSIKIEIAEPIKDYISSDLYNQFMDLKWFNLPIKLNLIFKKLITEKTDCTNIEYSKFIWFNLNKKVEILCQIKEQILNCEPEFELTLLCEQAVFSPTLFEVGEEYTGTLTIPYKAIGSQEYTYNTPIVVNGVSFTIGEGVFEEGENNLEIQVSGTPIEEGNFSVNILDCETVFSVIDYNFDITANWTTGDELYPVTDQVSFEKFLRERVLFIQNDLTNIVISEFSLNNNQLKCNLSANGINLDLSYIGVVEATKFGNINGLQRIYLNNNQIVNFNPSIPLPNSLIELSLGQNQIVNFNPSIPLPISLTQLDLTQNQIVNFNPSIPLPASLQGFYLNNNQIVNFNPSIPLPISLIDIQITNNQIVNFNPSIPLPNNLKYLVLIGNQIVNFNPSIPLPISLTRLDLTQNQMTTSGYTTSEIWANVQPSFITTCYILLYGNIESPSGTVFVTILTSKNAIILA